MARLSYEQQAQAERVAAAVTERQQRARLDV
jgi:hypothetical protein